MPYQASAAQKLKAFKPVPAFTTGITCIPTDIRAPKPHTALKSPLPFKFTGHRTPKFINI